MNKLKQNPALNKHGVNGSYSAQEMMQIEPGLIESKQFVERENNRAKNHVIYWAHVWIAAKKLHTHYVGFLAYEKELNNSECWDTWHDYLKSLAFNCR